MMALSYCANGLIPALAFVAGGPFMLNILCFGLSFAWGADPHPGVNVCSRVNPCPQ